MQQTKTAKKEVWSGFELAIRRYLPPFSNPGSYRQVVGNAQKTTFRVSSQPRKAA